VLTVTDVLAGLGEHAEEFIIEETESVLRVVQVVDHSEVGVFRRQVLLEFFP
jgi:hypothetical protein